MFYKKLWFLFLSIILLQNTFFEASWSWPWSRKKTEEEKEFQIYYAHHLLEAFKNRDIEEIKKILKVRPDVHDNIFSIIIEAVLTNDLRVVKEVVEAGADINQRDPVKKTLPLYVLAERGFLDSSGNKIDRIIIGYILKKGAIVGPRDNKTKQILNDYMRDGLCEAIRCKNKIKIREYIKIYPEIFYIKYGYFLGIGYVIFLNDLVLVKEVVNVDLPKELKTNKIRSALFLVAKNDFKSFDKKEIDRKIINYLLTQGSLEDDDIQQLIDEARRVEGYPNLGCESRISLNDKKEESLLCFLIRYLSNAVTVA